MDTHESAPLFVTEGLNETQGETNDTVLLQARELLRNLEHELTEVESAVARLEDGTYGRCDVCDAEVDATQLVEDPSAHRCAAHLAASSS